MNNHKSNWGNRMEQDAELNAMNALVEALGQLDEGVRERVLRWAADRYGVKRAGGRGIPAEPTGDLEESSYQDVASLFDAADPQTDTDRALAVGYWFQQCKGQQELDAQAINNELKNMGHGIANITDALTRLAGRKPAAVRQIQKKGTTKQARKRYRLTTAGIETVKRMISGRQQNED